MSNNTLKKPVLLQPAGDNHQNSNNFGQMSVPNSSANQAMAVPTISVQNPQNVYFIYGNPTIPMTSSSSPITATASVDYEQRLNVLENRVTAAIEKFEKMLKANEEKPQVQRFTFGANVHRQPSLFGPPSAPPNMFNCASRSFERPPWLANDNNESPFARTLGFFEQRPATQHGDMGQTKSDCRLKMKNPNIVKLMANHNQNNLDIVDGIAKPCYTLRDMSDDENQ